MTRRARSVPAGGGQHFDAGDPPRRKTDRELDEFRGRYVGPERDDPAARAAVVAYLVGLLDRPAERG